MMLGMYIYNELSDIAKLILHQLRFVITGFDCMALMIGKEQVHNLLEYKCNIDS